ncbi:TetR/AcrR family transcriptional regulator [Allokutzneria sp. A3M-2-11 16]|uniref:TetR/AcrR family transcriptional regulator n=1 Tax=Allokutzneria sp. A3M-2-11 16 TaxID=2962043 RepID=UPI0020B8DBAB|nr:WHG domain-containing protein [Allokutzneria sp. A3M-2-11 16]MCP3800303.1 TetR/AcrR family transcriptional regulator [Allokutzneria sp. A3M-2-11 16]
MDRRQRYREQTRDEAKRIALEQLAEAGPSGISVNAIAKRMGVTGPALYRYFANRDALLTDLIEDAYNDLADTMQGAVTQRAGHATQMRALATAMREWAVAQPHRYLLLFGTPVPGYQAPMETLAAAHRSMTAVLATVGEDTEPANRRSTLYRQLSAWGEKMQTGDLTPKQLHWGVTVWTRLHGVISLEITNQFEMTGVDPELVFKAEVEALVAWGERG